VGLDVYLYRCPDRKLARFNEAEYEKATEGISERLMKARFGIDGWSAFDKLDQSQKDEFWSLYKAEKAPIAASLGIDDERSAHVSDQKIEIDSALHPKHYFKIGYLRSSYNDSGFNSYARRLGLPELGDIFDNEEGEYEFTPDWAASKDRAIDALAQLRAKDFGFDVVCVDPNFLRPPSITDEKQALEAFKGQFDSWNGPNASSFESYENGTGWFIKDGTTIHAAIPGTKEMLGRNLPCTYLIIKRKDENWYEQALEVVIETCNWALEQPDSDQLYMHWSG
jgi:hypothetical protein